MPNPTAVGMDVVVIIVKGLQCPIGSSPRAELETIEL